MNLNCSQQVSSVTPGPVFIPGGRHQRSEATGGNVEVLDVVTGAGEGERASSRVLYVLELTQDFR